MTKKKPNREQLHLETSGFLHNKNHLTVFFTLSEDFFFIYFSLLNLQDTVTHKIWYLFNKRNFSALTFFIFIPKVAIKHTFSTVAVEIKKKPNRERLHLETSGF